VPACHPPAGVAAAAATWSPSSHRVSRGFPKPHARSISDRLWFAVRSPFAAIVKRSSGGSITPPARRDNSMSDPSKTHSQLPLFFSRMESKGAAPAAPRRRQNVLKTGEPELAILCLYNTCFVVRFVGDRTNCIFWLREAILKRRHLKKGPTNAESWSDRCRVHSVKIVRRMPSRLSCILHRRSSPQ
jgi:hypothetical protein